MDGMSTVVVGSAQVVLVVDEEYRSQFFALQERDHRLVFADPGKERQDSVFNGLQKVRTN